MVDVVDEAHWRKTLLAISQHIGVLHTWKLIVTIENSTVRYFVGSDKDIGLLSNNLEGVVLRPLTADSISVSEAASRKHFINFVSGGNLLDLREKYLVKNSLELVSCVMSIKILNSQKAHVKVVLNFKNAGGEIVDAKRTNWFYRPIC